jgi:hypothetical protein
MRVVKSLSSRKRTIVQNHNKNWQLITAHMQEFAHTRSKGYLKRV